MNEELLQSLSIEELNAHKQRLLQRNADMQKMTDYLQDRNNKLLEARMYLSDHHSKMAMILKNQMKNSQPEEKRPRKKIFDPQYGVGMNKTLSSSNVSSIISNLSQKEGRESGDSNRVRIPNRISMDTSVGATTPHVQTGQPNISDILADGSDVKMKECDGSTNGSNTNIESDNKVYKKKRIFESFKMPELPFDLAGVKQQILTAAIASTEKLSQVIPILAQIGQDSSSASSLGSGENTVNKFEPPSMVKSDEHTYNIEDDSI